MRICQDAIKAFFCMKDPCVLTLRTLCNISNRRHIEIFFLFSQKTGFYISCNLHEMSNPFSGKNKKKISIWRLLNWPREW